MEGVRIKNLPSADIFLDSRFDDMTFAVDFDDCTMSVTGLQIKKLLLSKDERLIFSSYFEFPNIGKADVLYIATDENKQYLWSVTEMRYVATGSDWHDIQIIQGGTSDDENIDI